MSSLVLCMRSPFPITFLMGPSYYFPRSNHGTYRIGQPANFALLAVMGGTGIALLSQSTFHRLQWALCFRARG